jgi:archaellum component FlaC
MNLTTSRLVSANESIKREIHLLKIKVDLQEESLMIYRETIRNLENQLELVKTNGNEIKDRTLKNYKELVERLETHIDWLTTENDFLISTINAIKKMDEE